MDRIINRFDLYMKYKKLNDNQVTTQLQLSVGLLGKARKGESDLGKRTVDKILKYYQDINRVWLLTGEGAMLNDDNETPFQRINKILSIEGLSQKKFDGHFSGILPAKSYENAKDKFKENVVNEWVDKCLRLFPKYSREWILTGKGEMLQSEVSSCVGSVAEDPSLVNSRMIPLIPLEAFCGYGTPAFEDEQVEEYYQVKEFKQADFLMRLKGNSMYPKYSSGDIVACRLVKETLFFQWNKIYAIYTKSQGVMVKRVNQSSKEGCILLVSDNEKYAPFDVPLSDIQAIALVIGVIRVE